MPTFSAALMNEYPIPEFVRLVEAIDGGLGYDTVFVPDERFYKNPYALLALAADRTESVRIGTGVTNPYTRNPVFTASALATIDELSGGRAVLGIGAGSPMVLDPLGIEQDRPIGALRDAIDATRRLLDGETVTMVREEFELHGVSLDFSPRGRVPVYVGGRGPQILSLGGHVGDGVLAGSGLTSVEGMEYARERVARGAEHGDRSADDVDLVCWAFLSIAEDEAAALDAVTPITARIVDSAPRSALEAIGMPSDGVRRLKALDDVDGRSPAELREAMTTEVVRRCSIVGTPEQCRRHVQRLSDADVGHVSVMPHENAENDALRTLEIFSEEVIGEPASGT